MTDTLTDDLRAAFHKRAAEIPERSAPGLVTGYVAPPAVRRARARWPLAVTGTAAAALAAVALLAGRDLPRTNTADAPPPPTTMSTAPTTWRSSTVLGGDIDGRRWELTAKRNDRVTTVRLSADGLEGSFSGGFGTPLDLPDGFQYAHLGPCCRLAGWTMLVGVMAPDTRELLVHHSDGSTLEGVAEPSPNEPEGFRYVVVPVPPGVTRVTVERVTDDGTVEPLDPDPWEISTIGG